MNEKEILDSYKKKLELIKAMNHLEGSLIEKRNELNRKISNVKETRNDLIETETENNQPDLFRDMDQFLIDIENFIKNFS